MKLGSAFCPPPPRHQRRAPVPRPQMEVPPLAQGIRADDKISAPPGSCWIGDHRLMTVQFRSENHVQLLLPAFHDEMRTALRISHEIGEAVSRCSPQGDRLRVRKELFGGTVRRLATWCRP